MNGHRDIFRIHDLLDGSLSGAEESALRESLQNDDRLQAEYREICAVRELLGSPLDLQVPLGLRAGILEAVRADQVRRSRIFRLPSWAENTLVLGGAATLAGFVAVGRAVGADWAAPWLGRLSVGAVDALGVAKTAAVGTQGSLSQMDWAIRLVSTLSNAGWTALGSSSDILVACGILSLVVVGTGAWVLSKSGRALRGGLGHAHSLV